MNIKEKDKSLEEKIADLDKYQKDNIDELRADLIEVKKHYMDAPGVYAPNINKERHVKMPTEIYTTEDYRLDMGNKGEFNNEILNEDYIDNLIEDGSLKVEQMPDKLKLIPNELVNELKQLAFLIRACEEYIKKNPNVVIAFKDGLMALRRQYEESVSHLQNAQRLPVSDFLTNEAHRLWNINNLKESVSKTSDMILDYLDEFRDIAEDFIEF